jgi:cysteine desulfuration protein SufE
VIDEGQRSGRGIAPEKRSDALRIRGCVSQAWLSGSLEDGLCQFRCAADSPLVQGLLSCLCVFYSGAGPDEVLGCKQDPLEALGLLKNLSPTRQNGMGHARARIREYALAMKSGASETR